MKIEIRTSVDIRGDAIDLMMVTPHHTDKSMSIHGHSLPVVINCSVEQAQDLVGKLQDVIADLLKLPF